MMSDITKRILNTGRCNCTFENASKGFFHFRTFDYEKNIDRLIDDSKLFNNGLPIEILFGLSFKLQILETAIKSMQIDEIAEFIIDKKLLREYPTISKTFRDVFKSKKSYENSALCSFQQSIRTGYSDLDELILEPRNLKIIIHLVRVEGPNEYEKQIWQMTDNEKSEMITVYHQKGKSFFSKGNLSMASEFYLKCLEILEKFILQEKPQSEEWYTLQNQKSPILLDYCECKLEEKEFYAVIEFCTNIINIDPNNFAAYHKRAKANKELWNLDESERDFKKMAELNPLLEASIKKDISDITRLKKIKYLEDKNKYKNLFS